MTPFARGTLLRTAPGAPAVGLHALAGPNGILVLAPHPNSIARPRARLARAMRARRLDTIWTTWEGDPHVDHVRCATLARALASRFEALASREARVVRYPVRGRFVETPLDRPGNRLARFVTDAALQRVKAHARSHHATRMTPLMEDDPEGFVMPAAMQRHFVEHDEPFVMQRVR